ncbi:MAG: hypothetical protein ABJM29_03185 [Rhizobiaceae bacterium]
MAPSSSSVTKPNSKVGLAVLSWRAPDTLIRTLESYEASGLIDLVDRKLLYFNDLSDSDKEVAAKYGYDVTGGPNSGIPGGMIGMTEAMDDCEFVLLMQNDLPVVVTPEQTARELRFALDQLESRTADLANLRHRWLPGQAFSRVGKYLKYWPEPELSAEFRPTEQSNYQNAIRADSMVKAIRRRFRGWKANQVAGGAYNLTEDPEKLHPDLIEKVDGGYLIDSSASTFSDQSLLLRRSFYLDCLIAEVRRNPSKRRVQGFISLESSLNHRRWWGDQHFKIAFGDTGIFSHDRRDGFQPT